MDKLLTTALDDEQTAESVQRLARELLPQTGELADLVTSAVIEAVPEVAPSGTDDEIAAVRESSEQNIGAILSMLAFGVVPGAIEPPLGTLKVVHQTVAGGGDLVTVLRAFRMGHAAVSQLWLAHIGQRVTEPALLHSVVGYASERLFTYFDAACEQLAARYRQEFPEGGSRGRDSRRQVLDRLLAGEPVENDPAGTSLGYDLRLYHVGVVAVPLEKHGDARVGIDALAASFSAGAVLTQPAGYGTWWAWLGAREHPGADAMARLTMVELEGVLVGVGEPQPGPEGFRLTHEEARAAECLGRVAHGPNGGVLRHRDVELAGLLCHDPARARRLAADRLGALAARDPSAERLRETLRAFLANGRNKARTSEVLHVHQKTVAYRLTRAEELLGRPLPQDCSELEAALLIDLTLNGR